MEGTGDMKLKVKLRNRKHLGVPANIEDMVFQKECVSFRNHVSEVIKLPSNNQNIFLMPSILNIRC